MFLYTDRKLEDAKKWFQGLSELIKTVENAVRKKKTTNSPSLIQSVKGKRNCRMVGLLEKS
jgi:hypothetical protein